jgi:hypothetical protein
VQLSLSVSTNLYKGQLRRHVLGHAYTAMPAHSLPSSPMDVVSTDQTQLRLEKWIPEVHVKKDHIQMTFPLPLQHLPALRCVLYRRYVQEWGSHPECTVEWIDRTQQPVTVLSLPPEYLSIENIPKSLPH